MTACPLLPSLRQTILWDHMVYGSLLAPSPQVLKRASLPFKPIRINSDARDTFQTWRHGKCDAGEGGEKLEVIGRRALSEEAFLIQTTECLSLCGKQPGLQNVHPSDSFTVALTLRS